MIYAVVTKDATITFYGISAAESAMHVALQVDQEAYLRKATAEEVSAYWAKEEGIIYSGSETNGDHFELRYSNEGEACLFATVSSEQKEAYWEANPGHDVATAQRQLYRWGYDMLTPNNLHKDVWDAF